MGNMCWKKQTSKHLYRRNVQGIKGRKTGHLRKMLLYHINDELIKEQTGHHSLETLHKWYKRAGADSSTMYPWLYYFFVLLEREKVRKIHRHLVTEWNECLQ